MPAPRTAPTQLGVSSVPVVTAMSWEVMGRPAKTSMNASIVVVVHKHVTTKLELIAVAATVATG